MFQKLQRTLRSRLKDFNLRPRLGNQVYFLTQIARFMNSDMMKEAH